ncbi:MAG: hypothetical protein RL042_2354 [Nitrospirota bacterium]|jgi:hypothetical protein
MKTSFGVVVGLLLGMALVIGAQYALRTDGPLLSVGVSEAATSDSLGGLAEELLVQAKQYDEEAKRHEAEARRYEERAAAITPLMDVKGFQREGWRIAGDSHKTIAAELRYRAMVQRLEAERLQDKQKESSK